MSFAYALTQRGTSYLIMIDNEINNIISCYEQNYKKYHDIYNMEIIRVFLNKELFVDSKDVLLLEIKNKNINSEDIDQLSYKYIDKFGDLPKYVWLYRNSETSEGGLVVVKNKPIKYNKDIIYVKYKLGTFINF